ncbi:hypothetical protein [Methanohalophilus profundi]|uniref:hypothetical protein n=1 Tax=Methanohalophilus profundi TaxID=2138083 RepID=UPI00101BFC4A|nr:hypothetical protein [Methanohalophilus profundi]
MNIDAFEHALEETTGNKIALGEMVFLLPVIPIIYGWVTKDKVGGIVVGVVPITSLMIYGHFLGISAHPYTYGLSYILKVTAYIGVLDVLGGGAGYLASERKIGHLLVAICLSIVWMLVIFSGIN